MSRSSTWEDFDEANQPSNPQLNCTVREFLDAQKKSLAEKGDPNAEYECKRCGDCCVYNYYHLSIEPKVVDELYRRGGKWPNGYWVLISPPKLTLFMPTWGDKPGMLDFDGNLPPNHVEFLIATGRRHGYWVLATETNKIIVYCPSPCIELEGPNFCRIYAMRPKICRQYLCGRYPKK